MSTLRETSQGYIAPPELNITDLGSIDLSVEILEGEGEKKEGGTYTYKYMEINGNEYRIPSFVLEQIKDILKLKPSVSNIKVTKTGSGRATRYKTEALD